MYYKQLRGRHILINKTNTSRLYPKLYFYLFTTTITKQKRDFLYIKFVSDQLYQETGLSDSNGLLWQLFLWSTRP